MTKIFSELSGRELLDTAPAGASLLAAAGAGLVDALLDAPGTAHALAADRGLDPAATALVLGVLESFGLAQRLDDDTFTASDELRRYDDDAAGGARLHLRLCGHISEFLRTGIPLLPMDGTLGERESAFRKVAMGLRPIFEGLAETVAAALPPVRGEVLDVGAGSGVWSLAVAEAHPHAHVTALDLPEVAAVFQEAAHTRGLAGRTTVLTGDYHQVPIAQHRYDLVILGNVLHLEPPERARSLVHRMVGALRSGGRLVVVDTLRTGPDAPNRVRSMYALALSMRTGQGTVHTRTALEGWLAEAGTGSVTELPAQSDLTDVLVATR